MGEPTSDQIVHGCCRGVGGENCTKRTWLYLPGRVCAKCLAKIERRLADAIEQFMGDDDE